MINEKQPDQSELDLIGIESKDDGVKINDISPKIDIAGLSWPIGEE